MGKPRTRYTTEFKIEAVRLYESSDKSASQIERELGIGKGNLWRWIRKYGSESNAETRGPDGRPQAQKQIRALERENQRLR